MTGPGQERVTLVSLAHRSCWVAWQTEARGPSERPTKIPYSPVGQGRAKANDPATWGTRDAATVRVAALAKPFDLGGVGLELCALGGGRSIGGIDLDTCYDPESGVIAPWAMAVVDNLNSYTEVSPSGAGVKVFFLFLTADHDVIRRALGKKADGELKFSSSWSRKTGADHPPAIELHTGNRYFAVTDRILAESTDELREVPTAALLKLAGSTGPAFVGDAAPPDACPERGQKQSTKPNGIAHDQSRSVIAFRVGAEARRAGADYETMCGAIREHLETADWYVEKGLANDRRELRRIWDKTDPFTVYRADHAPNDNTDPVLGELIVPRNAPLVTAKEFVGRSQTLHLPGSSHRTIHHQNGAFYVWRGSHYQELTPEESRAVLYRFLHGARTLEPKTQQIVSFDPNKNRVANVLEALAAETQLEGGVRAPAWLDGAPPDPPDPAELVSCRNGMLHIRTRNLLPHTPALFSLNALPFDYTESVEPPQQWLEFLDTIWPDDAASKEALQEFFGLALTADTSHQKAFLIVGPRRSGKGTVARILTEMLGATNVCSPTLSSLSTNFGIQPMIGKRLAIISDARLSGKSDHAVIAERMLAITGEDALTIDRKNLTAWTGKLDVRFLVLTNELPRLTDASGAFASRFIILLMTNSFYGREDRGLMAKLRPELPGILHWSLAGLDRLQARGHFISPKSACEAVREMGDLGSPISAFLRDRCHVEPGASVLTHDLYAAWSSWCHDHGRDHRGTAQTFGRDLSAAVPGLKTTQPREGGERVRRYEGVRLRSDQGLARSGTRVGPLHSHSDYYRDDPGSSYVPPPSHSYSQWHK